MPGRLLSTSAAEEQKVLLQLRGVESTKISKSTPSVVTLTAQAVRRVTRESAMLHSKDRTVSSQTTSAVLGNETHASTFLSSQSVTPNVDGQCAR
ncbi:hypothetical protein P167DRAFT_564095 [Morchella conica CCBAS932]|uniref:Uncharacterized protein n=1 Tax=Morchella conica CCBAS932 TaxID=1392247 RepID=A0A3N4KTN2_9PEZI|nr:hypothetical protein P167DRAFT_564095 [Morchella conica CCBAS932]